MSFILWSVVSILVLLVVLGIVFAWKLRNKNWEHQTDYRAFFWIGLIWTAIGIPYMFIFDSSMSFLLIMGVVFLAIGAANKDKWDQKKKLTPEQKKIKIIAMVIGIIALALGLIAFMLFL
jgi:heme/copper-type cytochrome/quinol oxidase subunit 2